MAEAVASGASGASEGDGQAPVESGPARLPLEVDNRLPPDWWRKLSQRSSGDSVGTYDVYVFSPERKKFRSCNEVLKWAINNDLKELDPYIFDFSAFGTGTVTLGEKREQLLNPKKKSAAKPKPKPKPVIKKKSVSKVAHKLLKVKVIKKKGTAQKVTLKKKAPVKTFAQKLVVKMNFQTPTKHDPDEQMSEDSDSESESENDSQNENKPKENEAAEVAETTTKSAVNKKDSTPAKSPKKTPGKTPQKGKAATLVMNGHGDGDKEQDAGGVEAAEVDAGGDNNILKDIIKTPPPAASRSASPRKRSSSRSSNPPTPLKEVNDDIILSRLPTTPSTKRPRRSSSRDSAPSPAAQVKGAVAVGDASFQTPKKRRRDTSRDSVGSLEQDGGTVESSGDIYHGQVDGAAADTPPKRGRGRPRKDAGEKVEQEKAEEPDTPRRGRGRPRKGPLNSPRRADTAESEIKTTAAESSAADSSSSPSPTKRPRGRPKLQIQPEQSDPEPLNPPKGDESLVKRGRGRPRKSLPSTDGDTGEPSVKQSEVVKDSDKETTDAEEEEESPVKRGRGRPRKQSEVVKDSDKETTDAEEEEESTVKRGRGRPRKQSEVIKDSDKETTDAEEEEESTVKRGRGRPRKQSEVVKDSDKEVTDAEEDEESLVKRGRGRPRKQSEVVKDSDKEVTDAEEEEESPVKRGRGRPRKTPLTPASTTPAPTPPPKSADGNEQVRRGRGRPPKTPTIAEPPIKKATPAAPKSTRKTNSVSVDPEDSITESPEVRQRGRPRKATRVPEVPEKLPRGRPRKLSVEPEPESNVIVTTAEIHREASEDDDLPVLTYEGEHKSLPETKLHKEPPLLVKSGNSLRVAENKLEAVDAELPPLIHVAPRKSSRKPKPNFHKDFVSPTRKIISIYEQGRVPTQKEMTAETSNAGKRGRPRKSVSDESPEAKPQETSKPSNKDIVPVSGGTESGDLGASSAKVDHRSPVSKRVKGRAVAKKVEMNKTQTVAPTPDLVESEGDTMLEDEVVSEGLPKVITEQIECELSPTIVEDMVTIESQEAVVPHRCLLTAEGRAILSALLLDHAYTKELTYTLPPETAEEPELEPELLAPVSATISVTATSSIVNEAEMRPTSILEFSDSVPSILFADDTPDETPKETEATKAEAEPMSDPPKVGESPTPKEKSSLISTATAVAAKPVTSPVAVITAKPKVVETISPEVTDANEPLAKSVENVEPEAVTTLKQVEEPKLPTEAETKEQTQEDTEKPVEKATVTSVETEAEKEVTEPVKVVAEERKPVTAEIEQSEATPVQPTEQPKGDLPTVPTVCEKPQVVSPSTVIPASPSKVIAASPIKVISASSSKVIAASPSGVVPASPCKVTPASPSGVIPASPCKVTPASPIKVIPASPSVVLAASPNKVIAASPSEVIPASPSKVIDASPSEVIPASPSKVIDASPSKVIAASPSGDIPASPIKVIAASPSQVIDASPSKVIPASPSQVIDASPSKVIAASPSKVIAASPSKVIPASPIKVIPASPIKVIDASPIKVIDASQSKVIASSRSEVIPASRSKTLPEGLKSMSAEIPLLERMGLTMPTPSVSKTPQYPAAIVVEKQKPTGTPAEEAGGSKTQTVTVIVTPTKKTQEAAPKVVQVENQIATKVAPKRKANLEIVTVPVKVSKQEGKPAPGTSVDQPAKSPAAKVIKVKAKSGTPVTKTKPPVATSVPGLVKPMGIKGMVIVKKAAPKAPGGVPKKGAASPKTATPTSLAKLEKSLKTGKGKEVKKGHPGKIQKLEGKPSPVKAKKVKLALKEKETLELLKQKHGVKSPGKAQSIQQKKLALKDGDKMKKVKHGEKVSPQHKKRSALKGLKTPDGKKLTALKDKSPIEKKGLKSIEKHSPDKHKKSSHGHKTPLDKDKGKKSNHGHKDSGKVTGDRVKKAQFSLKDGEKSAQDKPKKDIPSVPIKDNVKTTSADKPLKGILSVKEGEKSPTISKKVSLTVHIPDPNSDTEAKSGNGDGSFKTPDKSCLSSKTQSAEAKSPNGSRRVSIGGVETREIDQTKSPGPPSTSFDLASLAFVPSTPKAKKRRKSSTDSTGKSPKVKKVAGSWSFTPLKDMPQEAPTTPTTPTTPTAPTTPTEAPSSGGPGGPKSILKKS